MTPAARFAAYVGHDDRRAAACNMIALVVAWNQPFYPFYIAWLVGGDARSACWTFLSTPFFATVPWMARRSGLAGRAMLPATGIANGIVSAKVFGVASGVEWFLLPCALIVLLAFRRSEWRVAAVLLALIAAAAALHPLYGAPVGWFTGDEYRRLAHLNGWSVLTLCLFILWRLGFAISAERRPRV